LPTGQFFDDELKQLKANQRIKQLKFVVLGIFFLLYAILVRVFMPNSGIWLVGGTVLVLCVVYFLILLRKRSNKIETVNNFV